MAENDRKSQTADYVTAQDQGQPDAWTLEAGQRGAQRLVEVAQVSATPEVAKALRLRSTDSVVVRRRLILLDGKVIELADSFYPLPVAQGTALAEKRKIKGGAPTLLAELGYRPRYVSEDLEFRAADDFECTALSLPPSASVLTLLRTTSTEDGSPYEVQLMVMKAPRRLHYEIEVG